jgi:anti-anti-sigma factor
VESSRSRTAHGQVARPAKGTPPPGEQGLVVAQQGPVLAVAGELDLVTAPILEGSLAQDTGDVRLDLTAVTFIDSSGVAGLVRLYRRCESDGCTLRIAACSPQVERVLRIVGLYDTLTQDDPA